MIVGTNVAQCGQVDRTSDPKLTVSPSSPTIFLLSPARAGGARAALLTNPRASFPLARQLRSPGGARLSDVYAFLSSLYFRGKLAYARRFADPTATLPSWFVIVPGRGLRLSDERLTLQDLQALADIEVSASNDAFVAPLRRDARQLATLLPNDSGVVLLGSIASTKYVEPLLEAFGERLLFPADFVGRGDMSRGGLLLRCAREGEELSYLAVAGTLRRGPRAKRIAELRRRHG